jgi:hypothetical protein
MILYHDVGASAEDSGRTAHGRYSERTIHKHLRFKNSITRLFRQLVMLGGA